MDSPLVRTIALVILYVVTAALAVLMWMGVIKTDVAAAPDTVTLTLTDPGHWTPDATLDTTQVETPPAADPIPVQPVCEAVVTAYLPDTAVEDLVDFGWTADGVYLYSPGCEVQ